MHSEETVNFYFIQHLSPMIKMIRFFFLAGIILSCDEENRNNHIQPLDSIRLSKLIDFSEKQIIYIH